MASPITESTQARRVELILRQIDSLPTLPAVATRLLQVTSSQTSHAREVTKLISADPALTAKILSLCRQSDLGIRTDTLSIDRAVVLLGFNAVRNAVLSIQIFELFDEPEAPEDGRHDQHRVGLEGHGEAEGSKRFDRSGFWRHCLAVGVAAELIAEAHREFRDLDPSTAFVCGLLHDLGKLALDRVLPKAFARVLQLTELNQGKIAEFERRILGIDHHTAGKRLAEQWRLPHELQDSIWLHGSTWEALPDLDHKRMVGLISLADALVRRNHLGFSGNCALPPDPISLAKKIGLDTQRVEDVIPRLIEEVDQRSRVLGLDDRPSAEVFLQSIQQANRMLGQLNTSLERRSRMAARQAKVLEAISEFQHGMAPGMSVQDVMSAVAHNAAVLFGAGYYAMLLQIGAGDEWLIVQYGDDSQPIHEQWLEPPRHWPDLPSVDTSHPLTINFMSMLPWIADYLVGAPDVRKINMLPLPCGWGTAAILLHDREHTPTGQQLEAVTRTWGSMIAAATQHDGARRLGEQLAEANRALADAQDKLLQQESLARLGEMAAGAAHEMNNPLTVISGRSQLLCRTLQPGSDDFLAARAIEEQSHRLSDLITALRMFADPPRAKRELVSLGPLLDEQIKRVHEQMPRQQRAKPVSLRIDSELPMLSLDGEQVGQAVSELVRNACQANPKTGVVVRVRISEEDQTLYIAVTDDGCGMNEFTLQHAMDPFFSSKPAGRQVGIGLPCAQQLAKAHGGTVDLRSTDGQGTTATLIIPLQPA